MTLHPEQVRGKWTVLVLTSTGVLLSMSLWFSASAVVPRLSTEWGLTGGQAAWLTMAVQIGFVVGAWLNALLNLPDRLSPRAVLTIGALAASLSNVVIPLGVDGWGPAVVCRFFTGFFLAWVYPVGMKIMATWTKRDRGTALGLLVGALTVGSALPHLIHAWGGVEDWKRVLYLASALSALGGGLVTLFGRSGPYRSATAPFRWRSMFDSFRDPSLRLANIGYLGHMWELYAMWTWIPVFMASVYRLANGDAERAGSLAAFFVIAAGGAGALLAGRLADRWGRCRTSILSLAISGSCALLIGLLIDRPVAATAVALVWGFAVVADSAQFSSAVSELGDPQYMGTLLTTQTCMGFLLTLVTIRMVPSVAEGAGWSIALAILSLGPAFGIFAMLRLKNSPEAQRMAGGAG